MKPSTLAVLLLLPLCSICQAVEWKLIERYQDMEMFYDTSSIQRNRDEIIVTTLVNYFSVRNRGDGEFRSKTTLNTVYCIQEKLVPRFSTDYSEHYAKGKIINKGKLISSPVETRAKTIAGEIHAAVCEIKS